MPYHDRVVVHVRDCRGGSHRPRGVVSVPHRRESGAKVDDLPYPRAGSPDGDAADEVPVVPAPLGDSRVYRGEPLGHLPVSRAVVLPAEPVVVNAGDVRPRRVDARWRHGWLRHVPKPMGTGASARSRPAAFSWAHSPPSGGARCSRALRFTCSGDCAPTQTLTIAAWPSGKAIAAAGSELACCSQIAAIWVARCTSSGGACA